MLMTCPISQSFSNSEGETADFDPTKCTLTPVTGDWVGFQTVCRNGGIDS